MPADRMLHPDSPDIDFLVAPDGTVEPLREPPECLPGEEPQTVPLTPRPETGPLEQADGLGKEWTDMPKGAA